MAIEGGQAAHEELPFAQGRTPRQVAEHAHRSGLIVGLELLQRLTNQSGVADQLRRGRPGSLRMNHDLVRGQLADPLLQLRRTKPFLDLDRLLLETQRDQQPDQFLQQFGRRHPEV